MNESDIDRLGELANIGAGHAATAFAHLVGRPIWMDVPKVYDGSEPFVGNGSHDEWTTGVIFEFDGYLSALVGILFRGAASETVVRSVVGEPTEPLSPHSIESALMEIGNIIASHVASAIADTVGVRLLPSIPTLAMWDAQREFQDMIHARGGDHTIRIECALRDKSDELEGLLVLVPDAVDGVDTTPAGRAGAPSF